MSFEAVFRAVTLRTTHLAEIVHCFVMGLVYWCPGISGQYPTKPGLCKFDNDAVG
jgi:hypothetical protein